MNGRKRQTTKQLVGTANRKQHEHHWNVTGNNVSFRGAEVTEDGEPVTGRRADRAVLRFKSPADNEN